MMKNEKTGLHYYRNRVVGGRAGGGPFRLPALEAETSGQPGNRFLSRFRHGQCCALSATGAPVQCPPIWKPAEIRHPGRTGRLPQCNLVAPHGSSNSSPSPPDTALIGPRAPWCWVTCRRQPRRCTRLTKGEKRRRIITRPWVRLAWALNRYPEAEIQYIEALRLEPNKCVVAAESGHHPLGGGQRPSGKFSPGQSWKP